MFEFSILSIIGLNDSAVLLNFTTFSGGMSSGPYFLKAASFSVMNSSVGSSLSQWVIIRKTCRGEKLEKNLATALIAIVS